MSLKTRIHPPLPFPLDVVGSYPTGLQEEEVQSAAFTFSGTTPDYTLSKNPVETGAFEEAKTVFRNGVEAPLNTQVDEGITVTWNGSKITISADITAQADVWTSSYWY